MDWWGLPLCSGFDMWTGFFLVCSELESQKTMSFTGTQQKCRACEKTVYPMELLSADGVPFHKSCFKCFHCKSTLQVSFFILFSPLFVYEYEWMFDINLDCMFSYVCSFFLFSCFSSFTCVFVNFFLRTSK